MKKTSVTREIKSCRICDSSMLTHLFSLGTQYVNNFIDPDELSSCIVAPLELLFCENCTLVQLKHTAPQELLYSRFYWYKSGVTKTMRTALRDVALSIEKRCSLNERDTVLDIGSNDGTLLRSFSIPDLVRIGVEPAQNLAEEGAVGLDIFINDFWDARAYFAATKEKARVVTALGMFYDMDDPNQFIADSEEVLADDGIFVAQLMCLSNMINCNDVGNICHEHLEYYSFRSLEYLFERNGLEIFDIETNEVNGGSYRIFAKKKGCNLYADKIALDRVNEVRRSEEGLSRKPIYREFFARIERNKKECVAFIRKEKAAGKRIWVYGASTKGNVILQYYGLDHTLIDAAAEKSPWKWGKFTVGSMIPCRSEEEARASRPDYFLVLPYAFFDEFYEREYQWRSNGGRFIVPLPEFRVVG